MTTFVYYLVYGFLTIVAIGATIFVMLQAYKVCKILSIKRLTYKRYFSEEGVFEGEDIYFIEEISNRSFVPMFHIEVESNINSNIKLEGCIADDDITQQFVSPFHLMPFTTIKRMHKAVAKKRGFYKLETSKVEFAGMELFLDSIAELYVYPKQLTIEDMNHVNLYLQYNSYTNRPLISDPFSFAGVREYHHTDPYNSINFKATAKRGELMVNHRDYLLGRKIKIYVNFQPGEEYIELNAFEEILEQALSYSSYIIGNAVEHGFLIGFSANCRLVNGKWFLRYPISTGQVHYIEMLKEMAGIRAIYGNSFASVIDMDIRDGISDCEIYIITIYVDEGIDERIDMLKRMGNSVHVILLEGGQDDQEVI